MGHGIGAAEVGTNGRTSEWKELPSLELMVDLWRTEQMHQPGQDCGVFQKR